MATANANSDRRYAVFLSYRHADNKEQGRQWATWLHQVLEGYEIPADLIGTKNNKGDTIPPSLYPVFRDEEELPADADLTRNIQQALERSGLLVAICSPRAAESRFVRPRFGDDGELKVIAGRHPVNFPSGSPE